LHGTLPFLEFELEWSNGDSVVAGHVQRRLHALPGRDPAEGIPSAILGQQDFTNCGIARCLGCRALSRLAGAGVSEFLVIL
jgi:hypothetical protein